MSTRFKKHSSTDSLELTDKAKGHKPAQVTRPFFEKRVAGAHVQPIFLTKFTGSEMEDPDEKASVRSVDSSSAKEESHLLNKNSYEMRLQGHRLLDSWQEIFL